jgi:CRP-like cAMP-binding protein
MDAASLPDRQRNFLANISPDVLPMFLRFCRRRMFPRGAMLCSQGDPAGEFFIIQEGLVRTFYLAPSGKEITIGYWTSGDLAGTTDIFNSATRELSIQAIQDTEAFMINDQELVVLLRAFPDIGALVVEALAFKLRRLTMLTKMLGTQSVLSRLAQMLLIFARLYGVQTGDGIIIETAFTHEEIGNMIGASRQWVTVTLNQLQDMGLLKLSRHKILILDWDALAAKVA